MEVRNSGMWIEINRARDDTDNGHGKLPACLEDAEVPGPKRKPGLKTVKGVRSQNLMLLLGTG